MLSVNQLRHTFLDFFAKRDHAIVPSALLVPQNDKSLLFTNAGMVPFKDYFLGNDTPPYPRITSCQMCMRAGGKHNDLDNVGFTARHHTLFEMLGNFSFGDYFKQEAICYAWRFLTEVLTIPEDKLLVTVYQDDQQSFDIWQNDIQIPTNKIIRLGDESNFWQMGDTGPCGPCSEIFYDHGDNVFGGPPGSADEEGDRFVEIWNMVFMQYNRSTGSTALKALPAPCVDTGMGLERMTSVMQNVHDNYQTDAFSYLLKAINEVKQTRPASSSVDTVAAKKVIADHIRASVFLIYSRVLPDNEGRGYVLRRIIRRALRFGYMLGLVDGFFAPLAKIVGQQFASAYPGIKPKLTTIEATLAREENGFMRTLASGIEYLRDYFQQATNTVLDGETLFMLYDTYGFPIDVTDIIAKENGFSVDYAGYNACMQAQKQRSKKTAQFTSTQSILNTTINHSTCFVGYDVCTQNNCQLLQLFDQNGITVETLNNQHGMAIIDQSPFYAESGGQIGDTGYLQTESGRMRVADTQKNASAIIHIGKVDGILSVAQQASAIVDAQVRKQTAANHSATHLLHAALIKVLGDHVEQRGSLVTSEKLRFDFSHNAPLTMDQKSTISRYVQKQIQRNTPVEIAELSYDEAIAQGAKALFSEKYGKQVRVLAMGKVGGGGFFSVELCGGTHVKSLGEIGYFLISAESALAAGVRRIEALTGQHAIAQLEAQVKLLSEVGRVVQAQKQDDILPKVTQLITRKDTLEQQLQKRQKDQLVDQMIQWQQQAKTIDGVQLLITKLPDTPRTYILDVIDRLKNALSPAIIVFFVTKDDDKIQFFCGVDRCLISRINAIIIVNYLGEALNGKGGGRDDMAQGGGSDNNTDLPTLISKLQCWIETRLTDS